MYCLGFNHHSIQHYDIARQLFVGKWEFRQRFELVMMVYSYIFNYLCLRMFMKLLNYVARYELKGIQI